eukprot:EW705587.1.p2 GENE.EW705587.1~~EW705587.1.p2  ORF type:complete len:202 (+),score=72.70 EW705587.1:43-606(+)
MSKYKDTATLKTVLEHLHPLAYGLLVWIITSNRAYLRRLRPKERFASLETEHQFVMVSSSSKREQMFLRAKDAAAARNGGKGSIYMFHGSPMGNWHSILRTGLKTSGGAGLGASGPSIWMANDYTTSQSYGLREGKPGGWKNSRFGDKCYAMAILEVVNDKSKGVDGNASVNVISDTDILCTRYFLI